MGLFVSLPKCSALALVLCIGVSLGACAPETDGADAPEVVDYARDIRPILAERCFACHGPAEAGRAAELRLDTREGAISDRSGRGAAIVPGSPDESLLVQRIESTDVAQRMPVGGQLEGEQIALLRRWIAAGAPYERHWAFVAPRRPMLPDGPANPVAAFIHARLRGASLEPSSRAAPATLIRRLWLDVRGLPPPPEVVRAFVADPSESAYESAVDEALASIDFAETLTSDWLDYAGYGDSDAIYLDRERDAWPYRDWVIDSFAHNRPLDDFLVRQLAGDLLPEASSADRVATSFLRQHPSSDEAGIDEEEYRTRYAGDRATQVGVQLLGITVQCARCHDHKYDPIPQADFYRLLACFNRTSDAIDGAPFEAAGSVLLEASREAAERVRNEATAAVAASDLEGELAAFERTLGGAEDFVDLPIASAAGPDAMQISRSGSTVRAEGEVPLAGSYVVELEPLRRDAVAFRLALGPRIGVVPVLSELTLWTLDRGARTRIEVAYAFTEDGVPLDALIDGSTSTGESLEETRIVVVPDRAVPIGARVRFRLDQFQGDGSLFSSVQIASSGDARSILSPTMCETLATPPSARTPEEKDALSRYVLLSRGSPPVASALHTLREAERRLARLDAYAYVRVMDDRDPNRPTFVLGRGEFRAPGEQVRCAAPQALTIDHPVEIQNRAELARWIVSREHPTTARVLANHYFQWVFGQGLVRTPEDFGTRSEAPTHPELLDWLAVELIESGWDLRKFLRLLLMSETYRQSSSAREDLRERDPSNELRGRASAHRLSAERLRDQALAISGLLRREAGGPPTRPYHPAGLYESFTQGYGSLSVYRPDRSPERVHRRALYTFWRRAMLLPSIALLDAPSRAEPVSRRANTSTPTQALALMNDPLFLEAARALAERMRDHSSNPDERIGYAFELATARRPNGDELARLREAYDSALADSNEDASWMEVGESDLAASDDASGTRACGLIARIVLNLSETLSRE